MFASDEERARRLAGSERAADRAPPVEDARTGGETGLGLLRERARSGLYVASVPSGARAYAIESGKVPMSGRIGSLTGVYQTRTDGHFPRIPDGQYVVEVVMPWNDPGLNDPGLPAHRDYLEFRRQLARASDSVRRQLKDQYFVPDEATQSFVVDDGEQTYFVRQYHGVEVKQGRSKGVRALFLPRLGRNEQKPFSIEPLLYGYIPAETRYGFDEKQVRAELNFWEVPASDQQAIVDALARIGTIPYAAPGGPVRIFKIDLHDGMFTTRMLREGGT
jgi:hypothetical protein